MPKTAVNENYLSIAWKNYVGFTGQIAAMKPEAKSQAMQEGADD